MLSKTSNVFDCFLFYLCPAKTFFSIYFRVLAEAQLFGSFAEININFRSRFLSIGYPKKCQLPEHQFRLGDISTRDRKGFSSSIDRRKFFFQRLVIIFLTLLIVIISPICIYIYLNYKPLKLV